MGSRFGCLKWVGKVKIKMGTKSDLNAISKVLNKSGTQTYYELTLLSPFIFSRIMLTWHLTKIEISLRCEPVADSSGLGNFWGPKIFILRPSNLKKISKYLSTF